MRQRILSIATLAAFAIVAGSAAAEPVQLSKAQLDQVVAGTITQTNGGGNTPSGNANGVPYTNPAGNALAGQNK